MQSDQKNDVRIYFDFLFFLRLKIDKCKSTIFKTAQQHSPMVRIGRTFFLCVSIKMNEIELVVVQIWNIKNK